MTEHFFHPESGYQISVLPKYLARFGHEVLIVTSRMDKIPAFLTSFFQMENIGEKDAEYTRNTGVKIIRLPILAYKSGRAINRPGFKRFIDSLKPDVLYIHGESSMPALRFIPAYKRLKYALVMDSHMMPGASENRLAKAFNLFYRTFITPTIKKNGLTVVRTQDTAYVRDAFGIPLENAPWISFGSDTMLFRPDAGARERFRRENSISDGDFLVAYAGKLNRPKGGPMFSEAIRERFAVSGGRNVVFCIIGNTEKNAEGETVERNFSESQNRIIRLPTQKYADLPKFFQAADLFVIPGGASLIFYDVQACGVPVLWSDEPLNVERVSHGNGFHFKCRDAEDFRAKILMCAETGRDQYAQTGLNAYRYIKENFDYEDIARQYEAVLVSEYERQKALKNF